MERRPCPHLETALIQAVHGPREEGVSNVTETVAVEIVVGMVLAEEGGLETDRCQIGKGIVPTASGTSILVLFFRSTSIEK